jgi:hypothetical protein
MRRGDTEQEGAVAGPAALEAEKQLVEIGRVWFGIRLTPRPRRRHGRTRIERPGRTTTTPVREDSVDARRQYRPISRSWRWRRARLPGVVAVADKARPVIFLNSPRPSGTGPSRRRGRRYYSCGVPRRSVKRSCGELIPLFPVSDCCRLWAVAWEERFLGDFF